MFDIDGTFCHCVSRKINKISKEIVKNNVPWPIIYLGLLITNQEIDKEMIEIANESTNDSFVFSARPKETEEYTKKFFQKNGAEFFERIECLGTENIVAKKTKKALEKKVEVVVDDDNEVLKAVAAKGIVGCSPEVFKRLYRSGAENCLKGYSRTLLDDF